MATINDFVNQGKNGWKLSRTTSTRRKLFHDDDRLVFTRIDDRCALVDAQAFDGSVWTSMLGARILCRLSSNGLVARDHGRDMTFEVAQAAPTAPWRLTYKATFVEGMVKQPDEGGDGDPDPT
jgi:hypothetical protein